MDYHGNDIYCDVLLKGEADLNVVYENDDVLAFYHTNPYWPVHIIVIPKAHVPSLTDLGDCKQDILHKVLAVVQRVSQKVSNENGAASVLTNLGEYQHSKHLHFHVYFGDPQK